MQNSLVRVFGCFLAIGLLGQIAGCKEATSAVTLRSYNHMTRTPIHYFTLNEGMGSNAMPEAGGGVSCCVSLPKIWRRGLRAKLTWHYDKFDDDPRPLQSSQQVEIDIPEYKKPASVHVHFYENHRIKIVISHCSPGHPSYPLSAQDLMPWVTSGTKEHAVKYQNYGKSHEC